MCFWSIHLANRRQRRDAANLRVFDFQWHSSGAIRSNFTNKFLPQKLYWYPIWSIRIFSFDVTMGIFFLLLTKKSNVSIEWIYSFFSLFFILEVSVVWHTNKKNIKRENADHSQIGPLVMALYGDKTRYLSSVYN